MPNGGDARPRGGFGFGAGSRVFSSENFISEILTPIAAGFFLSVGVTLAVALLVVDSFILGPGLWGVIIGAAILYLGIRWLLIAYHDGVEHRALIAICVLIILILVGWAWRGIDWLIAVWPAYKFARWFYGWSAWWKVVAQVPLLGCWMALALVGIRLAVEIFDPGWSRRFERDAAITGVRATFPLGKERFPAHELNEQIKQLQEGLENAKVEMRRVSLDVTDGNGIDIAPDLPDDPIARRFYQDVVDNPDNFSTQHAIDLSMRAMWEKEIRAVFLNRGWAYWVNPKRHQDGIKLRGAGYKAICGLVAPYPD